MDAVDLTRSDSDEDVRLVKRQRTSSPDEEVQVVEEPDPAAPVAAGPDLTLGDKELLIIRATGPVRSAAPTFVRYGCAVHVGLPKAVRRFGSMHHLWIE